MKILYFKNFLKKIPLNSHFSTNAIFEKTLTVPTFCKLLINVPYDVNLTPLDVYEYPNCDKILIKIINKNFSSQSLQCKLINDEIIIEDSSTENSICDILAPIKADLNVTTKHGNVNISNFNGSTIVISTESGNVSLDKYYGENLKISCGDGNVDFKGIIQASDIDVRISETGSISTEKLQGLRTKLSTKIGNINVSSSYCNDSEFSTEKGNLTLKNIHKKCKIISSSGNIKIVGMDGQLDLFQKNGNADIQLSRIVDSSTIHILNGKLCLGISSECRENVRIRSAALKIDKKLQEFQKKSGNDAFLEFSPEIAEKLLVDCENCSVSIKSASWADNFPNFHK